MRRHVNYDPDAEYNDEYRCVDGVVMSHLLRRMYSSSYSKGETIQNHKRACNVPLHLISAAAYALNPGGTLVIQEMIAPDPSAQVIVRFKNDNALMNFFQFVDNFEPFEIDFDYHREAGKETGVLRMDACALFEFVASCYFLEIRWRYHVGKGDMCGWMTETSLRQTIKDAGMRVALSTTYAPTYVKTAWEKDFDVVVASTGEPYDLRTHIICVAEPHQRDVRKRG